MFRLRAYGGLILERDGAPYAGPASQRRRLAVLALLAASDAGVSRDRLTDYLWPDADPTRARHSLDEALSGLRRELRNDALVVGTSTLRLNPEALETDLAEHALALAAGEPERAAALYTGPFLDGFSIPGAGDLERWIDVERSRRARTQARVLEGLAAAATAAGDDAMAVHWHQARVALDPLDTPATLGLIRALTIAGNPTEGLRLARVHEALVREELDATPGPGWAAAIDAVRAGLARPAAVAAHSAPMPSTIRVATAPPPLAAPSDDAPRPAADVPPSIPRRSRGGLVAAAALLVAAGLGIATWSRPRDRRATASPAAVAAVERDAASVAVLPFANTSGDSADEHFSDGLTDELIGALSRVRGLKVTGHTSAFALRGRGLSVHSIGDTLGVATVLEGSVRRAGDRLKITAQLVNAGDNGVRWSATYDRRLEDVFAVQEEIAGAIVSALVPTLRGSTPIGTNQPRDLATYDLYLDGRYFLGRRTASDLRRAVRAFELAVARDPGYAPAYAGLADARVLLVVLADGRPQEEVPRARAAAAAALRLDPTVAEAHAVAGNIREAFDWDAAAADTEFARAVALDPSYATAHLYWGINLLNRGRFDDAVAELSKARALDPLSAPVRMQLGRAYVSAHRADDAVAILRSAIELNPQFAAAQVQLGEAYLQQGKGAAALAAFNGAVAVSGARDSANLAYALAMTGERGMAMDVLAALLASGQRAYLPPVPMAKAYVALHDADAAFRWLEAGRVERAAQMRTIRVTPAFDPLHADPRWAPLLRQIGLQP